MEFPDDVWKYIMEYLPKPVKTYPYIKELNNIIQNRGLFFEIYEPDYWDEYGNLREDYPERFYECYREARRINKRDLNYQSQMMWYIYEEPELNRDSFLEIFGYSPKCVTVRSIEKSRMTLLKYRPASEDIYINLGT